MGKFAVGHTFTLFPKEIIPPVYPDGRNALIVAAVFLVIFAIAEYLRYFHQVKTEVTRKFVHLFSGLVALSLPFLFSSGISIFALGLGFMGILLVTKKIGWLQSVHRVNRKSSGAFVYPLSILLVLVLSGGKPVSYQLPLLVLAFSDAFAALIGKTYGRVHFRIHNQTRSLEGSLAFVVISFVITLIPLLLFTEVGRAEALLIAFILSVLITCLEAISVHGLDNIFIPVGTLFTFEKLITLNIDQLTYWLAMMLGLFALLMFSYRKKRLTVAGMLEGFLIAFAALILGGVAWCVPLLIYYATFNLGVELKVLPDPQVIDHEIGGDVDIYESRRVLHTFMVIIGILFLYAELKTAEVYGAFVAAFAFVYGMSWSLFADIRAQIKSGGKEHVLGRMILNAPYCIGGAAGVAMALVLTVIVPGSPLKQSLMLVPYIVFAALAGLSTFTFLGLGMQARYSCGQCQLSSTNPWCHGVSGSYSGGFAWLDFERNILLSSVMTGCVYFSFIII